MNRIAIFTEGQSEQLFIEKLVKDIAGTKEVSITKTEALGGKKNSRTFKIIEAESKDSTYFVLIVNCGTDGRVKSDIIDRYPNLIAAGYQKIIAIRDVYPNANHSEIAKLRHGLATNLPENSLSVISFILSVMEFEAWIIAEYKHFTKIHPKITTERIKQELNIDILNDDLSLRRNPSKDLSDIYWLEMINYDKSKKIINLILASIDYFNLKKTVSSKFNDLHNLYQELELFFSK